MQRIRIRVRSVVLAVWVQLMIVKGGRGGPKWHRIRKGSGCFNYYRRWPPHKEGKHRLRFDLAKKKKKPLVTVSVDIPPDWYEHAPDLRNSNGEKVDGKKDTSALKQRIDVLVHVHRIDRDGLDVLDAVRMVEDILGLPAYKGPDLFRPRYFESESLEPPIDLPEGFEEVASRVIPKSLALKMMDGKKKGWSSRIFYMKGKSPRTGKVLSLYSKSKHVRDEGDHHIPKGSLLERILASGSPATRVEPMLDEKKQRVLLDGKGKKNRVYLEDSVGLVQPGADRKYPNPHRYVLFITPKKSWRKFLRKFRRKHGIAKRDPYYLVQALDERAKKKAKRARKNALKDGCSEKDANRAATRAQRKYRWKKYFDIDTSHGERWDRIFRRNLRRFLAPLLTKKRDRNE